MSKKQDDIFYQAYLSRDHRFDGKFFCGVKTTGIYCRPICPARPKRENVTFFLDALSAEKAGFRPCLRCRPECAPGSGGWIGKNATVKRALRLIESRILNEKNEEEFASILGMSARHLRRLFEEELGKTPKQISDANRLNFARKLIVETPLPITDVAMTSGFSSIRRFNEAFKNRFHRTPSELRKDSTPVTGGPYELKLSYRPPYDFSGLLEFYSHHLVSSVESINRGSYERVFKIEDHIGSFKVSHAEKTHELLLTINTPEPKHLFQLVERARRMLDVDSDPMLVSQAFSSSTMLKKILKKHPGLRYPTGWDPFEISVCSILGQLVSVKQARELVKQLVEHYGESVRCPATGREAHLFPTPEILAKSDLLKVKTTSRRRNTIRKFSQLVLKGEIALDSTQDPQSFREKLLRIEGIGPWTAEYISLRALGDTNAYPSTDLILKRVKENFPSFDPETLRPWRGYAAFYLWKEFAKSLTGKREKKS